MPATLKHPRPSSGLVGWAAGWEILDRIDNDRQREALTQLVRNVGVHGAPALEYAAGLASWLCGLRPDAPIPRKAIRSDEYQFIERRVREEIAKLDRKLFPRMRRV